MKKCCIKYTILLAAIALTTGCGEDNGGESGGGSNGPGYVRFTAVVGDFEGSTPGTTAGWNVADAIGVYMVPAGGTVTSTGAVGNRRQTTTGDGTFSPATADDRLTITGTKDFVAYYPYWEALAGDNLEVDLSDQADPRKVDILYVRTNEGYSPATETVALRFGHSLSLLRFHVTDISGFSLSGMKVEVSGVYTRARVDLATGTATYDGSTTGTIAAYSTAVNGGARSEALLPSGQSLSGVTARFTTENYTYEYTFSSDERVAAATAYEYDVELAPDGSVTVTGTIRDWTTVPGGDQELEPDNAA